MCRASTERVNDMATKAEKIVELSGIIDNKAKRIKKLKIDCGQQATKICVLNLQIKELEALRDTVSINCNLPDDCNDPVVLKTYMKACFDEAEKLY